MSRKPARLREWVQRVRASSTQQLTHLKMHCTLITWHGPSTQSYFLVKTTGNAFVQIQIARVIDF